MSPILAKIVNVELLTGQVRVRHFNTPKRLAQSLLVTILAKWAVSSVGRAIALHAKGHRFESCTAHWILALCGCLQHRLDLF